MKTTMNPLDLLAEVAVSCKDEDKSEGLQSCDGLVEPEINNRKLVKDNSSTLNMGCSSHTNDNGRLPQTEMSSEMEDISSKESDIANDSSEEVINHEDKQVVDYLPTSATEQATTDAVTSSSKEAESNTKVLHFDKEPSVSEHSADNVVEPAQPSQTDDVSSNCLCPKINDAVVCGSMCSSRSQRPCTFTSSLVHPISLIKDSGQLASSEQEYTSNKSAMESLVATVGPAAPVSPATSAAESLAQRVTRLLSPNFKLTMTDTIPSVLHNRNFSSLLIGNVGSATMRTALTSTRIFPHPVAVRSRATVPRKYPNISMSAIPVEHPLLDHDYCYQNYYELVQAAAKLIKERNTKKKAGLKQDTKATPEEGQPVKRKYRTKRIIAEEMRIEADRRAALKIKAISGDELAQKELDSLAKIDEERELAAKKKASRKRRESAIVEVEMDSDEEVMNEIRDDIDMENPVRDHDSSFKDQFVYFGSKKYKSRSRHLNKAKDPYELFWKTGQLKTSKSQARLNNYEDQEINDVLDVLGLSPTESQTEDDSQVWLPDTPTDSVVSPRSVATSPSSSIVHTESTDNESVTDTLQQTTDDNIVQLSSALGVGLDDLLQGITADQVSELIQVLNKEPNLESVGVVTDGVFEMDPVPKATNMVNGVQTLSSLAADMCIAHNIQLPGTQPVLDVNDNQCPSQPSQVTNISLDFTEADLLTSDRNIDLDILNNMSTTPPRAAQPASLFLRPTGDMRSTRMISSAFDSSEKEDSSRSPVVVPVTMYWNTFPALLLDGVKYVRLIDISRQALPSKETGLLKKRAQSLGYEVITCTDLQRNLLVKYAFACPSRSNLMVSETGAAEVIASYMEKSEIEELSKTPDLSTQRQPDKVKAAKVQRETSSGALAEPVTLMPQVLIEHKPLQKSGNQSTNSTPSTRALEPTAPERSSRLRQIKSSYRRFLPRSMSMAAASNNKGEATPCAGQEENASDRGYHSDQSPDSLMDRLVQPRKSKTRRNGKPCKSARRSLSVATANEPVTTGECLEVQPCLDVDSHAEPLSVDVTDDVLADNNPPSPTASPTMRGSDLPSHNALTDETGVVHNSQLENAVAEPMLNVMTKSEIVHIRHIDFVPKRSGKKAFQDGELYMEFFKSLHSPCIQCCTCRQFYTLRSFSKHQHTNRKLATVKVRQRTEPRGVSIGSELWQVFQKKKQLFESNRAPLKKLSEDRLSKPRPLTSDGPLKMLFHSSPAKLGKRIPKQKKYNPDEVYYSNPCIKRTSRKRQAEAVPECNIKQSNHSDRHADIDTCVDR